MKKLHLLGQHGNCFVAIANDAVVKPEILKDPEVIKAMEQSLKILTNLVKEIKDDR